MTIISLEILLYALTRITILLHDCFHDQINQQLSLLFAHPFLFGLLCTCLLQSSSLTIMLVLTLLASNLIDIKTTYSFIMGANIGTCITSFLTSFTFIPLIILLFMLSLLLKKKNISELCFYLSLVLFSLTLLGSNTLITTTYPFFTGLLSTFIMQSSSAMIAYTQQLFAQSSISLVSAYKMILGSNIGTCITPLFAHLTSGKGVLKAILFHFLYNILGTLVFYPFLDKIKIPLSNGIQLACFHLLFNIITCLILSLLLKIKDLSYLMHS